MLYIEDYMATLDSTNKQCFETLERRWFHIERCYNLLDMHLDPTIRTTPSLIEDEAHLLSHLDQIAGARRSRGITVNVPFVEPSKIRLYNKIKPVRCCGGSRCRGGRRRGSRRGFRPPLFEKKPKKLEKIQF
jgi:hypothetical protein